MPGKTQTHTDAVLNVLRGNAVSAISPYVGLFTTAPTNDADSGVEVSGNNYSRQTVTFGAPESDVNNVRKISNTNTITFGPATPSGWGLVVAFGIYTAATAGTLVYWGDLSSQKTIGANDSAQFSIGALVVKED